MSKKHKNNGRITKLLEQLKDKREGKKQATAEQLLAIRLIQAIEVVKEKNAIIAKLRVANAQLLAENAQLLDEKLALINQGEGQAQQMLRQQFGLPEGDFTLTAPDKKGRQFIKQADEQAAPQQAEPPVAEEAPEEQEEKLSPEDLEDLDEALGEALTEED